MPSMFEYYGAKNKQRPTEWIAIYMMLNGRSEVPSCAWGWKYAAHGAVYRSPNKSGQITRLSASDGYLISEWGRGQLWRVCSNCLNEYPETREYWHRDSNGRGGLQTICKYCRCEASKADYRKRVALPA